MFIRRQMYKLFIHRKLSRNIKTNCMSVGINRANIFFIEVKPSTEKEKARSQIAPLIGTTDESTESQSNVRG